MMRAILVIAAILLVPMGSADSVEVSEAVPVRMHFHVHGFQDFPITTQPVDESFVDHGATMLLGASTCQATDPAMASRGHQTWYGFGSPTPVTYDTQGEPRIYHERGISQDLRLDAEQGILLDWYVTAATRDVSHPVSTPLELKVTLREGDDISVGGQAYNAGQIVAHGAVDPVILSPDVDHPMVSHHMFGDHHVYGFHVPLDIEQDVISSREGYNVRIDLYMPDIPCDDDHGMSLTHYGAHTSPGLRPGMDWHIHEALSLEVHPQFLEDELLIHSAASGVFGASDLVWAPIDVTGFEGDIRFIDAPHICGHSGCPQDLARTWIWNYTSAPEGTYDVTIALSNAQGTATTSKSFTFEIGADRARVCQPDGFECQSLLFNDREAPGLPMAWLLAGLGTLLLARRR